MESEGGCKRTLTFPPRCYTQRCPGAGATLCIVLIRKGQRKRLHRQAPQCLVLPAVDGDGLRGGTGARACARMLACGTRVAPRCLLHPGDRRICSLRTQATVSRPHQLCVLARGASAAGTGASVGVVPRITRRANTARRGPCTCIRRTSVAIDRHAPWATREKPGRARQHAFPVVLAPFPHVPANALYIPPAQSVHTLAPVDSEYLPAAHVRQAPAPGTGE